jgi:hypothetical protein
MEEIRLYKFSLPIDTHFVAMREIIHDRDIISIHKFIDEMAPYEPRTACDDDSHFITLLEYFGLSFSFSMKSKMTPWVR